MTTVHFARARASRRLELLGRISAQGLLSALFVYGGIDTAMNPAPRVDAARDLLDRIRRYAPLPDDQTAVRSNALVQAIAGVALALGIQPRWAAAVLAASLVPTTAAGHKFWQHPKGPERDEELIRFLSNASILGGLIAVAARTGP